MPSVARAGSRRHGVAPPGGGGGETFVRQRKRVRMAAVADTELIARHHHEPLGGVELRLAVVRQQLHVVVLSAEPALLIQADRR
jgi:hypothetical protein